VLMTRYIHGTFALTAILLSRPCWMSSTALPSLKQSSTLATA
jgi:hypothetical protein